ncbi:uncharacterized protein MELLADRAFT_94370 [Melampsora larici-populina 98AG31]|uniref:Glycoside hydrolase 131 catalytic N-terminal domain-containing protein n=1 Tax=Melampsora larici-populina (strain 98AG31 / pathotype 3-4-7) TaxID=747676 RepID=F4RB92_MELLP|nr:uncharacterized protein MELLADRAFT_94370 [Melampsora larici-populina 98AG31]EGG10042.1 hypothetical protein MELLADRAFT_94370 [Melampsora larici-populina 98AG31]
MHNFNSLFLYVALALSYCGTITAAAGSPGADRLFDFTLTADMKGSDADNPSSALSKLIKYVVKGEKNKRGDYLSIESKGKDVELGIEIKDSSIFCPGDKEDNCQHGFRRTDVLPAIDSNKTLVGTTVFHQSFRMNPKLPLNLTHGYLLSSIEVPSGDHVFDIFAGSDFSSNLTQKSMNDPKTIRIRDLTTKVLHSIPIKDDALYNTAIAVDWDANQLTVYASEGDEELKKVAGPMMNSPKVVDAANKLTGEWHVQLIKFPLPNPADPYDQRSDVPHKGIQEANLHEGIFFSRMYVEDGANGQINTSVIGKAGVAKSNNKGGIGKKTLSRARY